MHAGEGMTQADEAHPTPTESLILYSEANGSGPENVKIKGNTASSSYVSKCSRNGKMVLSRDTTTNNRRSELNPQQIMLAKNGATRTLSFGEAASTKALENLSRKKLTSSPDNPDGMCSFLIYTSFE